MNRYDKASVWLILLTVAGLIFAGTYNLYVAGVRAGTAEAEMIKLRTQLIELRAQLTDLEKRDRSCLIRAVEMEP